ncbi:hypothetical protein DRQ53_10395 [bacterium]|nr:MAG: hypothetical protein DRQ32_03105 [bacterium]RKZ14917.1 MAG: hypothetical protein DRQ53_10395 [bacterium]
MDQIRTWLLAAAVFLSPFASVGVLHALTGRDLGAGLQPAFVPLLLLIFMEFLRRLRERRLAPGEAIILVALLWTALAASLTWSVTDMGLAGERPWSKSLKQLVQWVFFVLAAVAAARAMERISWRPVERALSIGLLCSILVAVAAAISGPGAASLPGLDTNPSIASGSDELYLGHSFTGLSRLRGPMPEPLMFGSYLLAAVPLVAAAAMARRGRARWWRLATALLGAACLIATWSRGAWLGAAVATLVMAVPLLRAAPGRPRLRSLCIGGIAVAGAGLLTLSFLLQVAPWEMADLFLRRAGQSVATHDMSNMTRFWSWKVAWEGFLQAPIAGQGWGSYGFFYFRQVTGAASGAHFGWPVPNNFALLLLAESGIVGLSLWSLSLWPALRGLGAPSMRRVVLAGAIVGVLVQMATFSQWNLPHIWLLFAAGIAAGTLASGQAGVEEVG